MASNPRIDDLRKRLEKDPGSRLFAQLAEELRKAGELAEAIGVSREGLQKHPTYPSARMTLGRALMDSGDLVAARAEFESVVKGAPDNILASRFLGECLEGLGEAAAALGRYRTTLTLAPGDKQVLARIEALEAGLARTQAAGATAPAPAQPAAAAADPGATTRIMAGPGASASEPEPPPAPTGSYDPAPIPLAEADESFELEAPYAAPTAHIGTPREATSEARPAPAADLTPTIPFGSLTGAEVARALEDAAVPPPELTSPTLAELYFTQGFTDKAMEVYRQLLEREPGNERARARLVELEAIERHLRAEEARYADVAVPPADPREARRRAIERTIARLEGLLSAIRRE